jgi:hypothetical protein
MAIANVKNQPSKGGFFVAAVLPDAEIIPMTIGDMRRSVSAPDGKTINDTGCETSEPGFRAGNGRRPHRARAEDDHPLPRLRAFRGGRAGWHEARARPAGAATRRRVQMQRLRLARLLRHAALPKAAARLKDAWPRGLQETRKPFTH